MPTPARNERQRIMDIVLLWIVTHGGEWPDWGDPIKLGMISELASSLKNKAAGRQIAGTVRSAMRG